MWKLLVQCGKDGRSILKVRYCHERKYLCFTHIHSAYYHYY